MPTKIYKWTTNKEGQSVKKYLTTREVKAYIMKQNKWTADQYQKQYDIFKNKVRAYEAYQQAQGGKVEKQSISEMLYKEAKAKQLYGPNYKPSQKLQQIKGFSAYSITKGRQKAKEEAYIKKVDKKYDEYINNRFGGLMKANTGAKRIYDEAKARGLSYPKIEEALASYAEDLKWNETAKREEEAGEAIPVSSEVYGSDVEADFDIDNYL